MAVPLERAARRITLTLFTAQSLGSAATIVAATVAAIVGADLSGRTALAGLPASVTQLGAAFSALLWSLLSDRLGRRLGLGFGIVVGGVGALLALMAVVQGSFFFLLIGLVIMASARASLNLGRFAAAEVNPPHSRGRAVAFVVLGGTVGSVVGPALVALSGRAATRFGASELAGPYGVAGLAYLIAAVTLFLFLRPEPKALALEIAERYPPPEGSPSQARPLKELLGQPAILMAMSAMILGYAVMVMLMVITSLHMKQHDHGLDTISLVFSAHTLGMFAFSVVTGWLLDRWGRRQVIVSGALVLITACLLAPLSVSFIPLAVSLFLLGVGWNFCYVGGSTLLSDELSPAEKAQTQGLNDMVIGLVSAAGSALSGVILATYNYTTMGLIGAGISFVLLLIVLLYWSAGQRPGTLAAGD